MLELNSDWPHSADASAHFKEKSIVKSLEEKRNVGLELKNEKELYLACVGHSYKQSLFVLLCGIGLAREPGYQEMEGKKGQNCKFARLSSRVYVYVQTYALFVFTLHILKGI